MFTLKLSLPPSPSPSVPITYLQNPSCIFIYSPPQLKSPLIHFYLRQNSRAREYVFFFANAMPLTVQLCVLLFLCSITSCFGTLYDDCLRNTSTCGDVEFAYPFGSNGSGCGDPDFQLRSCDYESHTLMNIGGDEYHILESSFLENSSTYKILTIVNDNLWGGKCNFSGNYSQFWRPDSHFQVLETYTNLTLWKQCDQVHENISGSQVHNLSLCGSDWYYSLNPHLNLEGTTFCNVFQLPVRQNFSQQPINNKTLIAQGFEVTWRVDPKRDQSCEVCLKSNGYCGFNISKPATFLCYCPDGTSDPEKCPGDGRFRDSVFKI